MRKAGLDEWFQAQLKPEGEPLSLGMSLRRLEIFHFTPYELRDVGEELVIRQMQQAAILRAVYSPWQLRERLVDFWTNHFNIFARKGLAAYRKPTDEREVVRKHALGKFPDMLMASARSTAMLVYLDQQASHRAQPNENYARELMELHTLGVSGGYSQTDVMEVARCFTGWSEERRFLRPRGSFRFIPELHDDGEKTVLGHRIPAGGGEADGKRVVEILAKHPGTAKFVSRKLTRYFLGDGHEDVARQVAATYMRTDGDISAMMQTIFEAGSNASPSRHFKRPFDYIVSAIRATASDTDGGPGIQSHLARMGQPLYQWPMPDGYPDQTEAWTGSLLARWNFAFDLAHGRIPGTQADARRLRTLFADADDRVAVFQRPLESDVVASHGSAIKELEKPEDRIAVLLSSPEFQYR